MKVIANFVGVVGCPAEARLHAGMRYPEGAFSLDGKVAPNRGENGLHIRMHSGLIIKVASMAGIGG